MPLSRSKFVDYLKNADFRTLFIEEMGWNRINASFSSLPPFVIGETTFNIKAIAHRNGFQVLQCNVDELPVNTTCKKLDIKLRKAANDYICIFIISGTEHHEWVAPVKTNEKRDIVVIEYAEAEKAQFLFEKISGLSFDIDEVTTIVDVKERVQGAFAINSEKITKDFYQGFNKQHKAFAEFISGIDDQVVTRDNKNKQWYTSMMLNRLMFCYFIQKKGFLNGDENYLRNKLRWVQEQRGNDQFFKSFYKGFLVQLFHDGLNSPQHDDRFEDAYGRIPYLNGGMFDVHQIERDYENIDIKDEAFESLFEFFDKWQWHLDTRVTASGKDINPDVLGYIFEQYINDRAQMGAYYTKEDITEYIGRNTIIPYLLDATAKQYPEAFAHDGEFWSFIKNSGDEFIYDAVKKGVGESIPEEIAQGIDIEAPNLIERRKQWNNPTPANIGLPTEIWRETIERLNRYNEVKTKIFKGEITSVNDFITYNLNTPKIAYDFLNNTTDRHFVETFYNELLKVTILDPTCGSGAFLFAALNLLEPLYEVCIARMEVFNEQDRNAFNDQLSEIQNKYRSNIQYFIYKSIILRNLYGVDIMNEAVEIAKLRLFLKMVAVVEVDKRADNMGLDPLPDVDFNIRCGNTLVGYATEAELQRDLDYGDMFARVEFEGKVHAEMDKVAHTYRVFKDIQLTQTEDLDAFKRSKKELRSRLNTLNDLLNHHLYAATVDAHTPYEKWLSSHQPFHWIAEFYEIINGNGGFDVIIGNPPYVVCEVDTNKREGYHNSYVLKNYITIECRNLFAYVIERAVRISNNGSLFSMIIPMSFTSTQNMSHLRKFVLGNCTDIHAISLAGDWHPGKLFEGVRSMFSIICFCKTEEVEEHSLFTSNYIRWYNSERNSLFKTKVFFSKQSSYNTSEPLPKFGNELTKKLLSKTSCKNLLPQYLTKRGNNPIYYRNAGIAYYNIAIDFEQEFSINGVGSQSSTLKPMYLIEEGNNQALVALLNSNLFYLFYISYSDCYHLTVSDLGRFKVNLENLGELKGITKRLMNSLDKNSVIKNTYYKTKGVVKYQEFYPRLSKSIIDEIDKVLAKHYGFTEEELDFIINYDIKYRMGDELSENE